MPSVAKQTIDSFYQDFLNPRAFDLLGADASTRIHFIEKDYWIDYDAADEILEDFQGLVDAPIVHRPPCRLLIGPTCNGKSELLRQLAARNPFVERADHQGIIAPVIYIQSPRRPDEMAFFSAILKSISAPFNPSDRIDRRINQVLDLLKAVQCKVILIDEVHNVLAGSTNQHRGFQQVLRSLTNESQTSLVYAGVKSALNALASDAQLVTRTTNRYLPRWTNNVSYQNLIGTLESNLPLKKYSGVYADSNMRSKIFQLSGGLFGLTKNALMAAAIRAIRNGTERITLKTFENLDITPEGQRPEVPDGLD
jgi:hypothetical protein